MVPGANWLKTALTVIASQGLSYYQYTGRTINSIGLEVATFASPVIVYGSFQPVPRALYQQYGLDFNKNYYTFYSSTDVMDVLRDNTGDQLGFNGTMYQVESSNDWFQQDGWTGVLCVAITDATS